MNELVEIFRSLEEEIRLRILALLMENGRLCVCDLISVLQLPQSTVSRHLAHLKRAGWVSDRRESIWIYYSLRDDLSPLHRSLLPVLREHLLTLETAREDLRRLKDSGSACA